MGKRWTHITINVSDINRSVDFYTQVCGLSVVRDRRPEGRHNVWLGAATAPDAWPVFVLVMVEGEVANRVDHFGFQCDTRAEVDAMADLARQHGILAEGPTDSGGVVGYWVLLRDPDGHLVEFTHGQPLAGLAGRL
jgi:catechol 2,3-dioxygenase-like lactoylglutathione lyase family enzyme